MRRPPSIAVMRSRQQQSISDEFSNLVQVSLGEDQLFLELCCDTWNALPEGDVERWHHFKLHPDSASNFYQQLNHANRAGLPTGLTARWESWPDIYSDLVARNPRLELADKMSEIGESHNANSWPFELETQIELWVLQDRMGQPPFDDRYGIATQGFFDRMKHFQQAIGGWVFYNESTRCIEFQGSRV